MKSSSERDKSNTVIDVSVCLSEVVIYVIFMIESGGESLHKSNESEDTKEE